MVRVLSAIREFLAALLASPPPGEPPPFTRGERLFLGGAALAVGGWVFAFQMRRFLGLGTTSDLYVGVQLATSWLHGQWFHDNFFGNFLSVHICLLNPFLAIVAYPFGAPGLMFVLGAAAALGFVAMTAILRRLGVPNRAALAFALISTVMPLSGHVYQNDYRAFDIDLLEPVLALWLAYFLLRRRWLGTLLLAVALCLVKEDAPVVAVIVAASIALEDLVRAVGRRVRGAWNLPALVVVLLGIVAVPVFLWIMKHQQADGVARNFSRLHPVGNEAIGGTGDLVRYLLAHAGVWLHSPTLAKWAALAVAGTFGLIVLRPHLAVIGAGTALIAWLVQDELLWAPRFAPALAFIQFAGCLAFASAWHLGSAGWRRGGAGRFAAIALAGLLAAGLVTGTYQQWRAVPLVREIYAMSPTLKISPAERQQADRVFALYRREGRRSEPVMASDYLFRYAHDRNLYWYQTMWKNPAPEWILWDTGEEQLMTLWVLLKTDLNVAPSNYELKAREGRFLLLRRKAPGSTAPGEAMHFVPVTGEDYGVVRMRVRFKAGRAGYYEPLLSLGRKGNGDVFFVRYLSEKQLTVGLESIGEAVFVSGPIDYEPGRTYEVEMFCGSMLPPPSAKPDETDEIRREYLKSQVSVVWDGKQVLKELAQPHSVRPQDTYAGVNMARSSSASLAFSGEISDVHRGGDPILPPGVLEKRDFGPIRLAVRLPLAAAGVPEPLLVVGVPGLATLGYVRVLPGGRAKFGAEFWGLGAYESDEVAAPGEQPTDVVFSFPALFPPVGDPHWGGVPPAVQAARRSQLKIEVNGRVVLQREMGAVALPSTPIAIGKNPAGGSLVYDKFSGRVMQAGRLPLTDE